MKCPVHRIHTTHELNSSLSAPRIFKNKTTIYKAVHWGSHTVWLLDSTAMNCWDSCCLGFRQLLLWLNLPYLNFKSMHIQWTWRYMHSAMATFLIKKKVVCEWRMPLASSPMLTQRCCVMDLRLQALISTVNEITTTLPASSSRHWSERWDRHNSKLLHQHQQ